MRKLLNVIIITFCSLVVSFGQCNISDFQWEMVPCDGNQQFYIFLDFNASNAPNSEFKITESATTWSENFSINDLPMSFGPFDGDCMTTYYFIIFHPDDGDCMDNINLGQVCCPDCMLSNLDIQYSDCTDGSYSATFNFDYEGVDEIGFDVFLDGIFIDFSSYEALPFSLDNLSGSHSIKFCENDNPDCCIEGTVFNECTCSIELSPLVFNCDSEEDILYVDLVVNGSGVSSFFTLGLNGDFQGIYAYEDSPINLGPLSLSTPSYEFSVIDQENLICFASTSINTADYNCDSECTVSIDNLSVTDCDSEGYFNFDISFKVENPISDFVTIEVNGEDFGIYSSEGGFGQVGPILAECEPTYNIVVAELKANCFDDYFVDEPICCEVVLCNITNIDVELLACDGDGTYSALLNFDPEGVTSEFFDVFLSDGSLFESYAYEDLPVLLENFPEREVEYDFLQICDNEFTECCIEHEFIGLECVVVEECNIFDVIAEAHECDDEGMFFVDVAFNATNFGDEGFSIVGNGTNYGTFNYGETFYTIGPILGDCTTLFEFSIQDIANLGCEGYTAFNEAVCCPVTPDCSISNIMVEAIECDGDGTYTATLDFDHEGTTNSFFDVILSDGSVFGFFEYSDLPITINNFPEREVEFDFIRICDNDNPDCCMEHEFLGLNCEVMEPCLFSNFIVEAHECDDNNQFLVDLSFDTNNAGNIGFTVIGNGETYGSFNYGESLYTIGPLAGDCKTVYEFIILDNEDESCVIATSFEEPICCMPAVECNISNITVDPVECDGDGTYTIIVDFDHEGTTNQLFEVFLSDGSLFGFFQFDNLPITIENFPEREVAFDFIKICENDNADCCTEFEFEGLDCEIVEECNIFNVLAEAHECNDDGTFLVDIAFDATNFGDDGFSIIGNGNNYGTFDYGETFYTIGQLNGDCTTIFEFIIQDIANAGCESFTSFSEPICCPITPDCSISNVNIEPIECDGDGTYTAVLNFDYEGTTNSFFDVLLSDGTTFGFYSYDDLPVTLENFPEREVEYDFILICDNDNPTCCVEHEFIGLDCTPQDICSVSNVIAEVYECDEEGMFLVDIDFEVSNPESSGFMILGNGNNYGSFEYGESFYTIGPLAGDCETIYEYVVIDMEDETCNAATELLEPICCSITPDCAISNINVEPVECDGDGTYTAILNFDYEGNTNDFFDVILSDGSSFGFFAYDDLPVTLENFPEREVEFDFIKICDNDNPECCSEHEFVGLECTTAECNITNIIVEPIECDGEGTYTAILNFDHEGSTNDFFDVVLSDGSNFGFYAYEDLPVTLENFPEREVEFDFIRVCDNDNPECCAAHEFIGLDCVDSIDECELTYSDLVVEPCKGTEEFYITFTLLNTPDESERFDLFVNGEFFENTPYEQVQTVGPLFGDCETIYEFEVIDSADDQCSLVFALEEPVCCMAVSDCVVSFESLDAICDTISQNFDIEFELETNAEPKDFFVVYANEISLDTFQFGSQVFRTGPLLGDGSEYLIKVEHLMDSNCFDNRETGVIFCEPNSVFDDNSFGLNATFYQSKIWINNSAQLAIDNIQIFSSEGKYIGNHNIDSNTLSITLASDELVNGVYLIQINTDKISRTFKIPVIK